MRFVFAQHVLDAERRELSRAGTPVPVEPQVFDVLLFLLRQRTKVVSKDDLLDAVWGGRAISESTLTSRINAARRAVGDDGDNQAVIRTFPRKGFRFVGEVREEGPAPPQSTPAAPASPALPSIAVLPFSSIGSDPGQEHFADGLVDDITTDLSRMRWLFVIARNSSFAYKGRSVDVRAVGRDLSVRYILEGSVRTAPGRVRLSAQLVEAESGRHIWAQRYDRPSEDLFAVQDDIAESVVAAIEPSIYAAEGYRAQARHDAPEAWGLVMRAWSALNRMQRAGSEEALLLLREALAIDPAHARAHALLAWALMMGVQCGWYLDADVQGLMPHHAREARRLDPSEPWAGLMYAFVLGSEGRHAEARAEAARMMELSPNFAVGRAMFAWMLTRGGWFEEGVDQARRAKRLSPVGTFSGFFDWVLGFTLLGARRFADALAPFQQAMTEFPEWNATYNGVICVYGHLGEVDLARPILGRQRQVAPHAGLGLLRRRLAIFAHTTTLLEGLAKAGMPE